MCKFSRNIILLAVVALWGCSTADDPLLSPDRVWDASLVASKLDMKIENIEDLTDDVEESTRSLFVGGQTGSRFSKMWDDYDVAQVYKDGVHVGTLTPDKMGNEYSTLSGTLTGSFAVGDELTLYMPSADLDYTGQDGTIGTMSKYYDYMQASIKVASVDGDKVTTEEASFASVQAYLWVRFRDEDNKILHVKQVQIKTVKGQLVGQKAMGATATYVNPLVINTPLLHQQIDDYPTDIYVAIMNDYTKKDTYAFTVIGADGKTYKAKSNLATTLPVGKLSSAVVAVRCTDPDVQGQTAITPPESDDIDVQQVTL